MPLTVAQLEKIDGVLEQGAPDGATLGALRRIGGMTATRCDASDMVEETPFKAYARCVLFLLDGRDHCSRITSDPDIATGVVVVAKE